MKKRVLIADADEQFRNALVTALEGSEEFAVVGVAADGEEALQLLQTQKIDILVMDLLLSKIDGMTVLECIRSTSNRPKILINSAFISRYVAASAMRLGAQQFLYKPCSPEVIIQNMQRLINGDTDSPTLVLR